MFDKILVYVAYLNGLSQSLSISVTQLTFIIILIVIPIVINKKEVLLEKPPITIPILIWIFWVMISTIFVTVDVKFFKMFFSWWQILFFFLGYYLIRLNIDYNKIFFFIIAGAVVQSLMGIYEFFIKGYDRADGFFSHALTYANNLAFSLLLVLFILIYYKYLRLNLSKKYLLLSLFIISIGFLSSLSRGPIYFITIPLFVMIFFRFKVKGILIFVVVLSVILSFLMYNHKFDRLFVVMKDEGNVNRVMLWKNSLKMLQDYPVFGIGLGNFKKVFEKYQGEYQYVSRAHAHNAYIQMALNYGVPSVIIILVIFGSLFKIYYESARSEKTKWGILGISILLMYMLEGITENNFTDSEVNMYFWFLMGIIMGKSLFEINIDKIE